MWLVNCITPDHGTIAGFVQKNKAAFGTIKRSLGYSFFHRRRQENVDAEAASMFNAYDFKRLLSMFSTEELVTKFEESVM